MTVHSMPGDPPAAGADADDPLRKRRGRWKMLLLALVCLAPVVASYLTYYVIRPDGRVNYGTLIEPQRPLPAWSGTTLDGKAVPLASLRNQWLLVTVAGGACDATCENNLYLQRQLRETLGKEKDRLDRVWLVSDQAPVRPELLPALAQATVLRVDAAQLAQWLQPQAGHQLHEHLYLVDPIGNWMMRFPANMDRGAAARAKRDLDRLMRASGMWDQPGRPGA